MILDKITCWFSVHRIGPLCILQNVRGVEGQQRSSPFCECARCARNGGCFTSATFTKQQRVYAIISWPWCYWFFGSNGSWEEVMSFVLHLFGSMSPVINLGLYYVTNNLLHSLNLYFLQLEDVNQVLALTKYFTVVVSVKKCTFTSNVTRDNLFSFFPKMLCMNTQNYLWCKLL